MKYLISILFLMTLIGCGKDSRINETNYRDEDGDQIVDRNEISHKEKLLANLISLEKIEGEIDFYEGISNIKKHTLKFTNEINLDRYALNLLLKNRAGLNAGSHFSEFTHLKIISETPVNIFNQKNFLLHLKFKNLRSRPKKVYFINNDEKRTSFPWQQEMNLEISKTELDLLLRGQAYFALDYLEEKFPSFPQTRSETIKAKTYRTIIHDGQKTQVLYISKKLHFSEILTHLDIKEAINIDDVNLFNAKETELRPRWWFRLLSEDDIVLVKQSESELKNHFLIYFDQKNQILKRKNGFSSGEIKWIKSPHSRMALKLTGFKTELTFKIKKDEEFRGGGRDGDKCEYVYNLIHETRKLELMTKDLEDYIFLTTDGSEAQHQIILIEINNGWEIQVPEGIKEISINIRDLERSMFRTTGLIQATCGGIRTNQTAIEGEFSLDITSYIEKI